MKIKLQQRIYLAIAIFCVIIAIDQLVKQLLFDSSSLNSGIGLGLFSKYPVIVIALVALALLIILKTAGSRLQSHRELFALTLILAGASSNLLDRIRLGAVIDPIHILTLPSFNLADLVITFGALSLAVGEISSWYRSKKSS